MERVHVLYMVAFTDKPPKPLQTKVTMCAHLPSMKPWCVC